MRRLFVSLSTVCLITMACRAGDPAEMLPAGAIASVQLNNLAGLIDRVEKAGLIEAFYSTPQGIELLKRPDFKKALAVKAIVEQQTGMPVLELAKTLAGGEVALGMYGKLAAQPEFILAARVKNRDQWDQFRKRLQPFLDLAEGQVSLSSPAKGVTLVSIQKVGSIALGNDWLVAGTQAAAAQSVWQRLANDQNGIDAAKNTFKALTADPDYQSVRKQSGDQPVVTAYLATKALKGPLGNRLIPSKMDNPLASLWFGGLVEMAARSPAVGASLTVRDNDFDLRVVAPGELGKLDAGRRALFPPDGKPGTIPFPAIPTLIGGISFDRDIATWYTNREQLLESKALPGFDQFETGLANILPGKDFAKDVLSVLGRGITVVAAPQDYSHLDGTPGVKLPGFAVIIDLAKPKEGANLLNLFLQTLSAILNIEAGQQGRQPWVMTSETHQGVQVTFADYLNKPKGKDLPVVNNFTPAAALVGNNYLLCSSKGLCKQLIDAYTKPGSDASTPQPAKAEDWAVSGPRLADALMLNRGLLEAGGIKNGRTEQQAKEEVQVLENALRKVEKVRLGSLSHPWGIEVRLEGSWK